MYHPEYNMFPGQKAKKQVDDDLANLLVKKVSIQMNLDAQRNSNRIKGDQDSFMDKYGVKRG